MTIYLTIITTALVLTQIIRIIQNTINLYWQNKQIKDACGWVKRNEVTEEDFAMQRKAYRLIVDKLENEAHLENVGTIIKDSEGLSVSKPNEPSYITVSGSRIVNRERTG